MNRLPPEMLGLVLSFVPVADGPWRLADCRLVCRAWRMAVRDRTIARWIRDGRWALHGDGSLAPRPLTGVVDDQMSNLAVGDRGEVVLPCYVRKRDRWRVRVWTDGTDRRPRLFGSFWSATPPSAVVSDRRLYVGGSHGTLRVWSLGG